MSMVMRCDGCAKDIAVKKEEYLQLNVTAIDSRAVTELYRHDLHFHNYQCLAEYSYRKHKE
ncbi:hypothetical protein SEA_DIABLA_59 [Gordonia phage Diabla]|nr:hypothetical protein SEA_DIABLA_59 [Gordonia phage Diabla]